MLVWAFVLLVAHVAAQMPQCGGDFQQSSVVDPAGRTLFSINRSTGKTVIADLESPALTAALAKLDAMQAEIDRLKAALNGAPPAPAPAPSPVPAAGSQSQTQFTIWGTNICPSPLSSVNPHIRGVRCWRRKHSKRQRLNPDSLEQGSILPYLARAKKNGMGVIVFNPNLTSVDVPARVFTQADFLAAAAAPRAGVKRVPIKGSETPLRTLCLCLTNLCAVPRRATSSSWRTRQAATARCSCCASARS